MGIGGRRLPPGNDQKKTIIAILRHPARKHEVTMLIEKTLLEQFNINEVEIQHRMDLFKLTQAELDLLAQQQPIIEQHLDSIVEKFYEKQTEFDEIALLIGDSDTLRRLRSAQRRYIQDLFSGHYDHTYVNSRLRIGLVHKRIGVEPKLYLSASCTLKYLVEDVLIAHMPDQTELPQVLRALDKLISFDTALVFDTYIGTLLSAVENAKKRMEAYARELEEKSKILSAHAERDPLTELYNKRAMLRAIVRELNTAVRRKTYLSVIYIDVNKFKFINDTFGHAKGDEVLQTLGRAISDSCRNTDFPCRIGGDEFCVILPEASKATALHISDRIEAAFSTSYPEYSISIGICVTGNESFLTAEQLIGAADKAMYEAKQQSI
ncbi:GGDEF domain-containing protein [Aeromonas taiwanensis]|uniref:Diguanylate cyclase DosC n=2 Tax=Aeromonadaceae TaxID=84642 RepID=A0A5F0K7X7_9GAMM|nr:GGDEF domain-containing protein [Aeromonas taiwanensis]TFF73473.1 GGDEF domain-containing protein [Aeromonas taiwanensis]TFF76589.1 GGDEF domain-containing protein [Aeromonas taiwanensis]